MRKKIDDLDLRLISLLEEQGRETTVLLARQLGCSRHKVMNRMKSLTKNGVILSYMTLINFRVLSEGFYAMVSLQVDPIKIRQVVQEILKIDEFYMVYSIMGEYDVEAVGFFENKDHFERIVVDNVSRVEGVKKTYSEIYLKSYHWGHDCFPPSLKHEPRKSPGKDFDATDLRLAKLLITNGRASFKWIARQLGLTIQSVSSRIARLTKKGIISGYYVVADYSLLGFSTQALIRLGIDPPKFESVLDKVLQLKPQWADELIGAYDLLLYVNMKDHEELRKLIRDQLSHIDGVQKIDSYFITRFYQKKSEDM
ncbi:MAG TPA: Lrp/AsnC family transcriptional regulator [Candidatus Bathyarchaeia archaeon]|nr:Lrp/AsnC family transcriptional regulator [Candidatus Bathyarchaeia archaeon]